MDGRIARFHYHLHLYGAPDGSAASAALHSAHFERAVREQVEAGLSAALDAIFGDDPTVYIVRRVAFQGAVDLRASAPGPAAAETRLAERLSGGLAKAVVQAIAEDDPGEVVRFPNQADYTAQFISDLLDGRAWDRWYYGPFRHLREGGAAQTLRGVLEENREHLAAILARLHQCGRLESAIRALTGPEVEDDPTALDLLWPGRQAGYLTAEAARPLFSAALALGGRLGLRSGPVTPAQAFEAYIAAHPPAADWRDPRSLAQTVADMLAALLAQNCLRSPGEPVDNRLAGALAPLDWLDRDHLRRALWDRFSRADAPARAAKSAPGNGRTAQAAGIPGPSSATPRQKQLLGDLLAAVEAGAGLDAAQPDSAANALRLLGALAARRGEWAADSLPTALIPRLLDGWRWTRQARSAEAWLEALRRGDLRRAMEQLPATVRERAAADAQFLIRLGAPAVAVVQAMNGRPGTGRADGALHSTALYPREETPFAGALLLCRAILDARIAALAAKMAVPNAAPPLNALVFGLLATLAGPYSADDPALRLAAGLPTRWDASALATLFDWSALQARWLETLAGLRLLEGPDLYIFRLPGAEPGQSILAAGDASARLWPLARVITGEDEAERLLAEWSALWAELVDDPVVWTDAPGGSVSVGRGGSGGDVIRCHRGQTAAPLSHRVRPVTRPPDDPQTPVDRDITVHTPRPPRWLADSRAGGSRDGHGGSKAPSLSRLGVRMRRYQTRPYRQKGLRGEVLPPQFAKSRAALIAALEQMGTLPGVGAQANLTLALMACGLLRQWSRWLRGFSESTPAYLLDRLVRRTGAVEVRDDRLVVELDAGPLDVVLEMAGYFAPLEKAPWLDGRALEYRKRGTG